ncbi:hypothetical protein HS088_TW08G00238 [Tripterygium wilfordii]|uniref:DUF3444 domain-containing protein n=2 Tax=Tripterygium wilfordii TaxID=458696 RepID=A0A7J7DBD9_TRIWF|nr:hypothetical protein HS088_TW08G00238 [Tripterygium wilfordii]
MEKNQKVNRDKLEALREKWVAAIMILSGEFDGARERLLKAQHLCPELENIDSMLTVCDILLLSAGVKLSDSEIDCSWVLELITLSNTNYDARCYYRKLVTLLQPIRDEFPGTELALQLVQDAISKLSECEKFSEFELKTGISGENQISGCKPASSSQILPVDVDDDVETDYVVLREKNLSSSHCFRPMEQHSSLESNEGSKSLKYTWLPNDFVPGQVWAKEAMPRKYVRVNYVVSPDKVHLTFLEPYPILDREIAWKKENLPIVCGNFEQGNARAILEVSQFSHPVNCLQYGPVKPYYMIYPMKDEIWAMYQDLNSVHKGNEHERNRFWVVEILADYSDKNGVNVARLEKVEGCLTFFCREKCNGSDMTRTFYPSEKLSFSHRILAFQVPGIEIYGIREGSWHLEPNALPLNHGR